MTKTRRKIDAGLAVAIARLYSLRALDVPEPLLEGGKSVVGAA